MFFSPLKYEQTLKNGESTKDTGLSKGQCDSGEVLDGWSLSEIPFPHTYPMLASFGCGCRG